MPRPRGTWGGRLGGAAAGLLFLAGVSSAGVTENPCEGDCDGNRSVTVNEIVLLVNILLGTVPIGQCESGDCDADILDISCLTRTVLNALNGCPAAPAVIVFNGETNRLNAYDATAGFAKQTVIPSDRDAPGTGRDINGQICFTRGPQGQMRFIAGEDTGQGPSHETAGWGLFELGGTAVGELEFEQLGKLLPTYQDGDAAENYGCGFLSDGRLVTSDVGNQASGPPNGQLIIWFPPFENGYPPSQPIPYCKLDIGIGTAQQIAVDDQDRIYVSAARPGTAGVYRYTGPFPTSDTPEGGCDGVDGTGAPMATAITKERFIASGAALVTPSGVVIKPDGGFYVASVLNGAIVEYDEQGALVRTVLDGTGQPFPIPSGNPLGLGLGPDGTLYFADIGLILGSCGICPGNRTGTVRRLRFVDGQPQPPEIMDDGLNFPDGIGILELGGR